MAMRQPEPPSTRGAGEAAVPRAATQPVRDSRTGQQFRLRSAEVLASLGVLVAAATLIALIWLGRVRRHPGAAHRPAGSRRGHRRRPGRSCSPTRSAARCWGCEQSLRILKAAFQADPDHFDMDAWREQMPALTDVTDDAFIADSRVHHPPRHQPARGRPSHRLPRGRHVRAGDRHSPISRMTRWSDRTCRSCRRGSICRSCCCGWNVRAAG